MYSPTRFSVERLARIFREARYEIRPLLRAMFMSPAFRDQDNYGALIKSPVELVVGTSMVWPIKVTGTLAAPPLTRVKTPARSVPSPSQASANSGRSPGLP